MPYSRPGVYVTEGAFSSNAQSGSTTTAAGFVGFVPRGPIVPTKVSSWTAYKNLFGDLDPSYDLSYSVYHYFANGGRDAYVSRVYNSVTSAPASAATVNVAGTVNGGSSTTVFKLSAQNPGVWGNSLTATVTAGLVTGSEPTFTLVIKNSGVEVERWGEISLDPTSNRYVSAVLNNYSNLVTVSNIATYASAYTVTAVSNSAFANGSAGTATSLETATEWQWAVSRFDSVVEPLIVNLVGMTTSSVVNNAITYCEGRGDYFLVIDPIDVSSGSDALSAVSGFTASSYAAVYYPKLVMIDPAKSGAAAIKTTLPAGAILGLYSRVEAERTVAKAPAGYAYELRGAYGLATSFTETEQGTLYDANINTLKAIPGAGVIINGARTLKKTDISKYIPVRRSLNYVKSRAKSLTDFALFEPNNEGLWVSINTRLSTFLQAFWNAGGLKGRTAQEAFYIVCDSSNNTATSVENGEVHVQIGVALQTPAEFIVVEVSQFTGGSSFTENL